MQNSPLRRGEQIVVRDKKTPEKKNWKAPFDVQCYWNLLEWGLSAKIPERMHKKDREPSWVTWGKTGTAETGNPPRACYAVLV